MKIRTIIPCGHTRHDKAFCSFANAPEKRTLTKSYHNCNEIYRRSAVMLRRRDDEDHSP